MDVYSEIALKIIEQQEAIIGPLAVDLAKAVPSLEIDWPAHTVVIKGDASRAIDELVGQYEKLFGQVSVEADKNATAHLVARLPLNQQPHSLR